MVISSNQGAHVSQVESLGTKSKCGFTCTEYRLEMRDKEGFRVPKFTIYHELRSPLTGWDSVINRKNLSSLENQFCLAQ